MSSDSRYTFSVVETPFPETISGLACVILEIIRNIQEELEICFDGCIEKAQKTHKEQAEDMNVCLGRIKQKLQQLLYALQRRVFKTSLVGGETIPPRLGENKMSHLNSNSIEREYRKR